MNSKAKGAGVESHTLRDRLAGWRELLEGCGSKPTRKRVHALRVLTLRIQAEVEQELRELPSASHQAQAMLHFGKRATRLRKMLGSVRELDVRIDKLRGLKESHNETSLYESRSIRQTANQIERLETWLSRKRRSAAEKLARTIEKNRGDLLHAASDLSKAVGEMPQDPGGKSVVLLNDFQELSAKYPVFDKDNLHDFRKSIKKIRYLAEIHAGDAGCAHIATQMKAVQSAIGEWHDWQILEQTAVGRKHAKASELHALLARLTIEAFDSAVAVCHKVTVSLASSTPAAANSAVMAGRKKPAVREQPNATSKKKSA